MIPVRWVIVAAVQAAALALAWHLGAGRVQGQWDAAERERAELAASDLREQAATQRRASAGYQSTRAARDLRLVQLQEQSRANLSAPAPPTAGHRAGDIVLPGSLGRLLNAIAAVEPASAASR